MPKVSKRDKTMKRLLQLMEYEAALQDAEEDLLKFAEVTMPVEKAINDATRSKYMAAKHHRFMADKMMEVEAGTRKGVILTLPPRHGKSEISTRRLVPWYHGRHPDRDIIVATYNEGFAETFGGEVKAIVESPRFKQVFPNYALTIKSVDHLATPEGGNIFFLGRRSATTGKGGDLIVVDDPTKDDKEASSANFREDVWQWFTQTLITRRHNDQAALVLSQTIWHEDDLVGRLTDPSNPAYSKSLHEMFEVVRLPAIAGDNDPMGREKGEPLWPKRFGLPYLNQMRTANAQSWASLYQCDPIPESGVFYQRESIFEYDAIDLPKDLTMFACSDHAVSTKNSNDRTCLMPYGVDKAGDAWIMPDVVWDRIQSDEAVERMIAIMKRHGPTFWYGEKGQIEKSIGPFLQKRMQEEGVYCPMVTMHRTQDKLTYAHAARNRCAQGRIRFPRYAPWWPEAKAEMLKFPNARFDDFVDTVSVIGMQMNQSFGPGQNFVKAKPIEGTFAALKAQWREEDMERRLAASDGW